MMNAAPRCIPKSPTPPRPLTSDVVQAVRDYQDALISFDEAEHLYRTALRLAYLKDIDALRSAMGTRRAAVMGKRSALDEVLRG